jgi:hypothetical protein
MSNAIQFLESLGRNPALIQRPIEFYMEAVAALEVDEAQRQALLSKDHVALNSLLDGRVRMLCAVCAPDDNEQDSVPDSGDGDGDGVPDQDEPLPPQQ